MRDDLKDAKKVAHVVPTHIFENYVKCHVTGKQMPKFAKKRTAIPIYQNMYINTLQNAPESTWVQNLQMNKKVDPLERELIREIMEENDITTELMLQKLDKIEELNQAVNDLKHKLKKELHTFHYMLQKEDEAKQAAEENPRDPKVIEQGRKMREKCLAKIEEQKQRIKEELAQAAVWDLKAREGGFR
jgi:hypothetical protein